MKTLILIIPIIIILIPPASGLYGEVAAVLEEPGKVMTIAVDEQQLYVGEMTTIHIYSLKDYKFIKSFGKSGEGPQEFRGFAFVIPQKDNLLIWSPGKVSYFSKDGTFQSEKKFMGGMAGGGLFRSLGKNFAAVARSQDKDGIYMGLTLYDENLEKVKEITKLKLADTSATKVDLLKAQQPFDTFEDRAYIATLKGFSILVLNDQGKELFKIEQKDYKQRKFTNDDETKIRKIIEKTSPQQYAFLKDRMVWPDYYPAILVFNIDHGAKKLIVTGFKQENEKYECFIYSLDGKLEKRMLLPMALQDGMRPYPWAFRDGKLYQVIDNDEEEQWEVHVHKLY